MLKNILLGLTVFFIILISFFLIYWWWVNQPINPKDTQLQVFVVPQGQSATIVSKRLADQNIIKSHLAFKILIDQKNYGDKIQAGDFKLSPSMSPKLILETLTHGSLDYWITFPEGLRVEEYAEKLAQKANIDKSSFILTAKPHEGYLFPDTYLIPQNATAEDIVAILTDTFKQKSPTQETKTVILASLIEREAKHQQDRKLVSSVLHNRLKIGMALQIDATIQYILGREGNWWPNNLTYEDLKTPSSYNSYQNTSLPPGPIANPGLDSLKSAITPANTDYLYYVSDFSGYNHYATDLAGHNANIEKYLEN